MRYFKCEKCNLVIPDPATSCQSCGAKAVECLNLQVFDSKGEENLNKFINEGFKVVDKKFKTERFDEGDFEGFEYQLQRPV